MRRAIGVVRCSPDELNQDKHSPEIQRRAIRAETEREGWELLRIVDEIDISGRWDLERRTGLRPAVEAVEAGQADVIIVARFDRLLRSIKVQAQITERVERAGGDLYAIDSGFITNGNATQKLSAGFLGLVAQYHSDTTRERSAEGVERAVAAGIPPFRGATLGYLRPIIGERANGTPIHGPLVPDPATRAIVRRAWELRADGATVVECQEFLSGQGIDVVYPTLIKHFKSRLPLGELHHGKLRNLSAHPPIVERDLWQRVQDARVPSGRRARSERLLARLGVLRCGCGASMSMGNGGRLASGEPMPHYRCSAHPGRCPARASISADVAERVVWDEAREAFRGIQGRKATATHARQAAAAADAAEKRHRNLILMLTGDEDMEETQARLARSKQAALDARQEAVRLASMSGVLTLDVDDPRLTVKHRREIIAYAIDRAVVCSRAANGGRQGASRISVIPVK